MSDPFASSGRTKTINPTKEDKSQQIIKQTARMRTEHGWEIGVDSQENFTLRFAAKMHVKTNYPIWIDGVLGIVGFGGQLQV